VLYYRNAIKSSLNLIFIVFLISGCNRNRQVIQIEKRESVDFQKELSELLDTVQLSGLFTDSKTFVDFPLKTTPDSIIYLFNSQRHDYNFNLPSFIALNFDTLSACYVSYSTQPEHSITKHIDTLWSLLTRHPASQNLSSLISLKYPYIVPGGRFREIYYWDSYFTMLGLAESDQDHMVKYLVDNFSELINTYGHIPNGNRTYYLSRSQPPFYASMIELLVSINDSVMLSDYLQSLEAEYNFWMTGKEKLGNEDPALYRTVWLDDSTVLNRYWDNICLPRPESYKEDMALYTSSGRDSSIYRDIRASAESGWDFSSRWFEDTYSQKSINTTQIIPVDLNCLLYNLERTLFHAFLEINDTGHAEKYRNLAKRRLKAINRLLWDPETGFYHDYNFIKKDHTEVLSLAAMYPLFYEIADSLQALKVKNRIENKFLYRYGVVTTLTQPLTKEQWDYPNGWAPLQWITYAGLINYGYKELADKTAVRWMLINENIFYGKGDPEQKGRILEKYNVVAGSKGKGGEYKLQDGFGWTNGVYMKFFYRQAK